MQKASTIFSDHMAAELSIVFQLTVPPMQGLRLGARPTPDTTSPRARVGFEAVKFHCSRKDMQKAKGPPLTLIHRHLDRLDWII